MAPLRNILVRNTIATVLAFVSASEALIVHWLLLATRGAGIGLLEGLGLSLCFALGNVLILAIVRGPARRFEASYHIGRAYMVASLGALFSGPPLLAVFGGVALPVGAARSLGLSVALPDGALVAGGGAAVALGFGSVLWGLLVGQRKVRIERRDLPIRDLPDALHGLRIAHITDLHIGRQLRAPRLRRLLDRVNALEPDLIAITGDIFDFDPAFIEEGCRELAKLSARHGVFAILGNHDLYTGSEAVTAGVRALTSITLLRDEWAGVEVGGRRLYFIGVDDPGRGWTDRDSESPALERLAGEVPQDGPCILLIHRPAFFGHAARLGLPVMLCGHTHGGQISPPPPAQQVNVSRLIAHWTRGYFERGDSVLYVNRGLGVAGPPIRLNCPREIALLRLVPRR